MCFFFFFKQKTAYEMDGRLEFRRVLFRSTFDREASRDAANRQGRAKDFARGTRVFGAGRLPFSTASGLASAVYLRSEERRVGKECRSRWSQYVYKKKKLR